MKDRLAGRIGESELADRDRRRRTRTEIGDHAGEIAGEGVRRAGELFTLPAHRDLVEAIVDQDGVGAIAATQVVERQCAVDRIELLQRGIDADRPVGGAREAMEREQDLLATRQARGLARAQASSSRSGRTRAARSRRRHGHTRRFRRRPCWPGPTAPLPHRARPGTCGRVARASPCAACRSARRNCRPPGTGVAFRRPSRRRGRRPRPRSMPSRGRRAPAPGWRGARRAARACLRRATCRAGGRSRW